MKFLIIYHEIGLQFATVDREQKEILKQLTPSFEQGLLEDVIFLASVKPRLPEIIDLGSGSDNQEIRDITKSMEK